MNRIELVALFTSLEIHLEKNDINSVKRIVRTVLDEAQYVKNQKPQETTESPKED